MGVRFLIGDPPAKLAKQQKTSNPSKINEITHSRKSGRGRGSGVITHKKNSKICVLFFNLKIVEN